MCDVTTHVMTLNIFFKKHILDTDSAYTERYMGLPTNETMKSYQTSAVMHDIDLMRNKKFLLIHGTADGKYQLKCNSSI